jgi:hypothetical protein
MEKIEVGTIVKLQNILWLVIEVNDLYVPPLLKLRSFSCEESCWMTEDDCEIIAQ